MLLCSLSLALLSLAHAQKKTDRLTAYAITGVQKGATAWTEVRLVDLATGEELQTIYASTSDAEILHARTGKPVAKRDAATAITAVAAAPLREPVTQIVEKDGLKRVIITKKIAALAKPQYDQPFATTSAACAYDKKNNRLYYTPMGIAQLRYIDLKAKSPRVYYFEDEAFGVVKGRNDVGAQITRMVIAADGNGYALTNDGAHLVRFTAKKKPEITDLGPLTDDATNGRHSVHSPASYGGDMIADKEGNLWLVTAGRGVYKIGIESKLASYVGTIKGLPRGFSTNGAVAEGGSTVVVSSSGSTLGYYRFDLNSLQAEKISESSAVFNASDLANAVFAFEKKAPEEKPAETAQAVAAKSPVGSNVQEAVVSNAVSIYPNPVVAGFFKLSFADQKPGRYSVQLLDAAGKLVSVQQANVYSKLQVEEFRLPQKVASGNYIVRIAGEDGALVDTKKIFVQ